MQITSWVETVKLFICVSQTVVQITDMMLTIFYLIANDKFIIIYFSQVKASYVCLIFY